MNFRVMYIQNTISKIYMMMGLDSVSFQLLYHLSIETAITHCLYLSSMIVCHPFIYLYKSCNYQSSIYLYIIRYPCIFYIGLGICYLPRQKQDLEDSVLCGCRSGQLDSVEEGGACMFMCVWVCAFHIFSAILYEDINCEKG